MLTRFVFPVAVTTCLIALGVYLAILIPASIRLPVPVIPIVKVRFLSPDRPHNLFNLLRLNLAALPGTTNACESRETGNV